MDENVNWHSGFMASAKFPALNQDKLNTDIVLKTILD